MSVKCYIGNLDGVREGLVIASSQKKAAEIAQSLLYEFRNYWHIAEWPKEFNPEPFVLYTKLFDSRDGWIKGMCPNKSSQKVKGG